MGGGATETIQAMVRRIVDSPKDIVVATPEDIERFKDVPGTIIWAALHQGVACCRRAPSPSCLAQIGGPDSAQLNR